MPIHLSQYPGMLFGAEIYSLPNITGSLNSSLLIIDDIHVGTDL